MAKACTVERPTFVEFGVLFQSGALWSSMTVGDNVALPLQMFTKAGCRRETAFIGRRMCAIDRAKRRRAWSIHIHRWHRWERPKYTVFPKRGKGWAFHEARHSAAVRASGLDAPHDLANLTPIKRGAAEYGEMCAMCHLGPGVERSEMSQGLYPRAPELARGVRLPIIEQFWIVKHGIKMTAMPSWGVTHNDEILWDVVAFLQTLPALTPDKYRELTRNSAEEHEEMGGHGHMDHPMPIASH